VSIKINAPQGWYDADVDLPRRIAVYSFGNRVWKDQTRVRIVRESDWRRIMSVVNEVAAGIDGGHYMGGHVAQKIDALRKHVEKRKERET